MITQWRHYLYMTLAAIFGTVLALAGWRLWSDYRDFQMMRAFVFSVIQQQQQHPQTPTRGEKPQ